MMVALRVLDVDVKITRADVFNLFIKKFQSQSLLEEYMKSSPYVMAQLDGAEVDPLELHRAVVNIAEKMKAVDNTQEKMPIKHHTSLDVKLHSPNGRGCAESVEWLHSVHLPHRRAGDHAKHSRSADPENQNGTAAAGVGSGPSDQYPQYQPATPELLAGSGERGWDQKPVYSNGQAVKDDPDYSVALGADGIAQKLQIEKISRTFLS